MDIEVGGDTFTKKPRRVSKIRGGGLHLRHGLFKLADRRDVNVTPCGFGGYGL
jgi:hypothetical protein